MGQRLNIEIIQNKKTLANAYYHWSAYTSSSLELTKLIIDNVDIIKHEDDTVCAVRLLETTGALLTSEEVEEMKKINEHELFEEAVSRNEGLIAITKSGIDSTRRWEEGRVEVNLDSETVNFNVFWKNDKNSYLGEYEKSEIEYEELPVKEFDFKNISFKEFNNISSDLITMIQNEIYDIRLENGDVLSFIE